MEFKLRAMKALLPLVTMKNTMHMEPLAAIMSTLLEASSQSIIIFPIK
jgi:hypothetical protein